MTPAVDRRVWAAPSIALLLVATAVAAFAPGVLAGDVRHLPLLLSLVVFGMAHGAVDHRVARRLGRPQNLARFLAGYTVAALVVGSAWLVAPVAAMLAFLVVSLLHWGQGELWFAQAAGRPVPRSWAGAAAFVLARGSLPIALPVLAHPEESAAVATSIVEIFAPGTVIEPPAGAVRAVGLAAIALVVVADLVGSRREGAQPGREALELGVLGLFFAVVPPTFAVGLYFLAWHAPRHAVRLMAADAGQRELLVAGRPGRATLAFHREAAPLTAVALAGCAALGILAGTGNGGEEVVAVSLAVIAGLTWPHAAVVAWMDVRQGVLPARAARRAAGGRVRDGTPS